LALKKVIHLIGSVTGGSVVSGMGELELRIRRTFQRNKFWSWHLMKHIKKKLGKGGSLGDFLQN
jgi:hypothetical protein